MGKRFLISLLMVLVVVGIIAFAASAIFSSQYDSLMALEAEDPEQVVVEDALTGLPLQLSAGEDSTQEDYSATDVPDSTQELPGADANQHSATDTSHTKARVMLKNMTLEEKICQMLFVTPEALTGYSKVIQSGSVTQSALASYPVGGVIYFSSNLITADQTTEMLQNIQAYSLETTGRGLFIGVDEEGGSVARVADNLGTTAFDDMSVYGEAGDTAAVYDMGMTQAQELTALGFNVNFSPVADVLTNEENTVVKERSFGSDPELVADMVTSVVHGLTDGGILCAPKHFPGHGSTGEDTHDGFAASDRTLEELEACDLLPFEAAIDFGVPMIMVGHMTMTALDDENPACMSGTVVTGLLRDKLGYDGIIITDALNMSAISDSYTNAEAAVACISAGCDMLLCVSNLNSVVNAVKEAVEDGTIKESAIDASVIRILTAKYRYGLIP